MWEWDGECERGAVVQPSIHCCLVNVLERFFEKIRNALCLYFGEFFCFLLKTNAFEIDNHVMEFSVIVFVWGVELEVQFVKPFMD